jgi:hypothetical protein
MSTLSKQMQDWENTRKVDHARCGDISPCSRPICAAFFKRAVVEIEKLERAIEAKERTVLYLDNGLTKPVRKLEDTFSASTVIKEMFFAGQAKQSM